MTKSFERETGDAVSIGIIDKDSTNKREIEETDTEQGYDAHTPYLNYHFMTNPEMEFAFQWILGSMPMGGCEIGEAFYVAKQVETIKIQDRSTITITEEGTPEKWQKEWAIMAERKEKAAEKAMMEGHLTTARENYLKASNYYRTALVSMLPEDGEQLFDRTADKCRQCFHKAGELFDPPIEHFEIPFDGIDERTGKQSVMPGCFIKVDNSGKKRKTLIMIGGGETHIEDLYFYIAPAALRRGYNFLTVDLPGQGAMPRDGHYFREDTENQMRPIVDYAYSRPEIDRCRLAAYGISNGGYFVPRAAMFDSRIKAIVVSNAVIDNYKMFKEMPFGKASQEEIDNWPAFKKRVTGAVAWRWGTDIKGQVEQTKGFVVRPEEIYCHVLDLVAGGEDQGEAARQQIEFMNRLPFCKHLVQERITTQKKDGAVSHCIAENRTLMSAIVFDWLDKIFR